MSGHLTVSKKNSVYKLVYVPIWTHTASSRMVGGVICCQKVRQKFMPRSHFTIISISSKCYDNKIKNRSTIIARLFISVETKTYLNGGINEPNVPWE